MKNIKPGTLLRLKSNRALGFFWYDVQPDEVFMYLGEDFPYAQNFLNKKGKVIQWVGCINIEDFMNLNRNHIEIIET